MLKKNSISVSSYEKATCIGHGVSVKKSTIPEAGNGLFADRIFFKGNIITEFDGEIIDREEARKREIECQASHIIGLDYDTKLDGKFEPKYGKGGGSFANDPMDSQSVNTKKVTIDKVLIKGCQRSGHKTLTRKFLVATKLIKSGDEIFVNYGSDYWKRNLGQVN